MASGAGLVGAQQRVTSLTQELDHKRASGKKVDRADMDRLFEAQKELNQQIYSQVNQGMRAERILEDQARALKQQDDRVQVARGRAVARVEAVDNRYTRDVGEGVVGGAVVGGFAGVGVAGIAAIAIGAPLAVVPAVLAGGGGVILGGGIGGYRAHVNNRNDFNQAVAAAKDLENI